MITKEEWDKAKRNILADVELEKFDHPEIRFGQAVFNISLKYFQEVEWLRTSPYFDCFYNSEKAYIFLDELGRIVTKPPDVKEEKVLKDGYYILVVDNIKCAARIENEMIHDTLDDNIAYTQTEYIINYSRFIEEL